MKGPPPLFELLDSLREVLDGAEVRYAVTGGVATSWWGLPHFTHDLDVAVGVSANEALSLLSAFEEADFVVPEPHRAGWMDRPADTRKLVGRKFLAGSVWDVDVFLEESDFLRSVLARRVIVDLDGHPTPLVSPEDLVLFKLVAWRPKDQGHLDDLLLVVGPLDEAYLAGWANRLGVFDRLAEQWRRAGRDLSP